MFIETAAVRLRHTDRKRLLGHLLHLGDPSPERRAQAALDATGLLERKGLSWSALLPPGRAADTGTVPHDWQRTALALSVHPGVTPNESVFLNKLSGWRAPGADGLARLRDIADRVGGEFG